MTKLSKKKQKRKIYKGSDGLFLVQRKKNTERLREISKLEVDDIFTVVVPIDYYGQGDFKFKSPKDVISYIKRRASDGSGYCDFNDRKKGECILFYAFATEAQTVWARACKTVTILNKYFEQ